MTDQSKCWLTFPKNACKKPIWSAAIAAIIGVFALLFLWLMNKWGHSFKPLPLSSPSPGDVGTAFLSFLLVSLVVERAIQVYKNVWREPSKTELLQKVEVANTALEVKKKTLSAEPEVARRTTLAAEADDLARKKGVAVEGLNAYQSETREQTTWGGLLLGLVIALCGVRALSILVTKDASPDMASWQYFLFGAVDVLVTGALIGGGADGIHKIISVFTAYADRTKKHVEGQTP